MLFHETYLYIKIKVSLTGADGKAGTTTDWKTVVPANYLLNSMFKQVVLSIGNVQITPSSNNFKYKAYFETLLGYSSDAKHGHLSACLWNEDREKRSQYLNKGQPFDMMGRLHLDLTDQSRALLGGCKISSKLYTNPVEFTFEYGAGLTLEYDFIDAFFEVHRAGVSPSIALAHRAALLKSTAVLIPLQEVK